jgi:photosystem II stability/assembly factor-like uncharacterized protein
VLRRLETLRIDVDKSSSHHQSHSEIAGDNPCYRHLTLTLYNYVPLEFEIMKRFHKFGTLLIFSLFTFLLAVLPSVATDIQVLDLAFVDELHGWVSVLEPKPAIFRTSDGGNSWTRIPFAPEKGFYLLRFFDLQTGFALQLESLEVTAVFRTGDSGETWAKVTEIAGQHHENIVDLILTGPNDALMVGEGEMGRGYVVQLTEGGRT